MLWSMEVLIMALYRREFAFPTASHDALVCIIVNIIVSLCISALFITIRALWRSSVVHPARWCSIWTLL